MDARVRSLATLIVLGLVLLLAAVWGWSAISEPFPKDPAPPACVDREFAKGDQVKRRDVTVSVWNAGRRVGLAGLTMDLLTEAGFHEGSEGNTPGSRRVERAEIWTREPGNPAVRLVARQLGDVEIVRREARAPGVLVVVGDGFDDLVPAPKSVTARTAATVCGPPRLAR
jgi:hypothetical protein